MTPSQLSILIVDAWHDSAESLAYMLELYGHEISISRDGKSAIEVVKERSPDVDVVVVDVTLPRMNGHEVARQLCDFRSQKPLLIAISGYGQMEDRDASFQAGFDHFLLKPFAPRELIILLEQFAERRSCSKLVTEECIEVSAR